MKMHVSAVALFCALLAPAAQAQTAAMAGEGPVIVAQGRGHATAPADFAKLSGLATGEPGLSNPRSAGAELDAPSVLAAEAGVQP